MALDITDVQRLNGIHPDCFMLMPGQPNGSMAIGSSTLTDVAYQEQYAFPILVPADMSGDKAIKKIQIYSHGGGVAGDLQLRLTNHKSGGTSATNGEPDTSDLVHANFDVTVAMGTTAGWKDFTFSSSTNIDAGRYWLHYEGKTSGMDTNLGYWDWNRNINVNFGMAPRKWDGVDWINIHDYMIMCRFVLDDDTYFNPNVWRFGMTEGQSTGYEFDGVGSPEYAGNARIMAQDAISDGVWAGFGAMDANSSVTIHLYDKADLTTALATSDNWRLKQSRGVGQLQFYGWDTGAVELTKGKTYYIFCGPGPDVATNVGWWLYRMKFGDRAVVQACGMDSEDVYKITSDTINTTWTEDKDEYLALFLNFCQCHDDDAGGGGGAADNNRVWGG